MSESRCQCSVCSTPIVRNGEGCTLRTFCTLKHGHDGACVEVPRREYTASNFEAAVKR